jgi:hypothetical protein
LNWFRESKHHSKKSKLFLSFHKFRATELNIFKATC